MEDYVEDYKFNNCFWKNSKFLYEHAEKKFQQYMSIGEMFSKMSSCLKYVCTALENIPSLLKYSDDSYSSRFRGIQVLLVAINQMNFKFNQLYTNLSRIASIILEKRFSYNSKKGALDMCENNEKIYQAKLKELKNKKKNYTDAINKAVELFLTAKLNKKLKSKASELKNKKETIAKKKMEYKKQIEEVEKCRVDYIEIQGNIFASEEELERECTNEFKKYLKEFICICQNFFKDFEMTEGELQIIEDIDGDLDNKEFAEKNKTLMTGPKRNLYKEYSQDLNYYTEHFDIIKEKLKKKSPAEIREINKMITQDVNDFLSDIIKEEPDEIHKKIQEIAKNLKENNLTEDGYEYLEKKFQERYDQFKKWKYNKVGDQDFRKVGKEWDERFCYMHTFLGYFNKTRVGNKELNEQNFNFLCKAMQKILTLNDNEDADYSLCDLVVILSSTFYMNDPNGKNGKKYVNEIIKNCPIMQRQGFWVGLTRFELNEEIQHQDKIEDTLTEGNISADKLKNSIIAKLMSVTYNIIQFIIDSGLFNRIVNDIFKYCKINLDSREVVVGMMEAQIEGEGLTLKLDKELLLKPGKDEIIVV